MEVCIARKLLSNWRGSNPVCSSPRALSLNQFESEVLRVRRFVFAAKPAKQLLRCQTTHLESRCRHRGKRGLDFGGNLLIVKSRDRDIVRDFDPALRAFENCAGSEIVIREEYGVNIRMLPQKLCQKRSSERDRGGLIAPLDEVVWQRMILQDLLEPGDSTHAPEINFG